MSMWVTGRHPVEELMASSRQKPQRLLLSDAVSADVRKSISAEAASLHISCITCPREEWERRTGDRGGGGVAAEIQEYRYADFHDWFSGVGEKSTAFLLDGITDPQNFGAILRNARAFGADMVIVPKDRSCPVTAAVFRASAGAAAHVPLAQVTNLARTIEEMRENGFWIYAAAENGETAIQDLKPSKRMGIVLGSEELGIRKLVRERCDGTIRIPMEPGVDSLNVGVATGIIAFVLREAAKKH
jgi:23S rRNA (guanosine2251-2'-O)-methyltransferase